ncbi:putative ubiquitin-protein ligase E3 component (UBR1) [Aspergillus clavatus NRRL 1]|uniref:E3 ubiquitin-protein ligase n=1 Tax=Aspergillus clavatus (strain ATCC 1007 / CBS 513.65 / DSM 816 / NCTC 3887 / NRRL 1 / QM 1276 / 107) TaxID=344612 RepID=A1CT98_ASPCL|nr:ubiquitin-protein ligase E3 component (UBR1), putative [Aspergillus clavatus NRRL 1]EAW06535.1 ubiquitin-protein ligase E3 component (UBR1), putative [Aspergillus clavatus NRRL 1]
MLTECERRLGEGLLRLPARHEYRYGHRAEQELLQLLFRSLVGFDENRLQQLFPDSYPDGPWKLAQAQGAKEGAEYTEAARGRRCGHIFRAGEATYRCITCAVDETCVLCSRCFDSSDHTGHQYQVSLSSGNCGCCDCGDDEAWRHPLFCAIHTDSGEDKGKERAQDQVPPDWVDNIRMTIGRAMDYFCDVLSCSPEQLRLPKTEEGIRQDEKDSRLTGEWYGGGDPEEDEPEWALALWNDEKHTVRDVAHQVSRACRERNRFGDEKANETNDIGRSVIKISKDLRQLLHVLSIIEHIKVTVTVRSARDTFREQMCGAIVEWLSDIAGASIFDDNQILRHIVCEEMLKPWRRGSRALNAGIGMKGIDDHQMEDNSPFRSFMAAAIVRQGRMFLAEDELDDDDDDIANDRDDEDDIDANEELDDEDEMVIDLNRLREEVEDEDLVMGDADYTGDAIQIAQTLLEEVRRNRAAQPGQPPRGHQELLDQPAVQQGQPTEAIEPGRGEMPARANEPNTDDVVESDGTSTVAIPKTPAGVIRPPPARPPGYWLARPAGFSFTENVPVYEDFYRRTRLDWMILFDLRLWKKTRTNLRDLYISTVVSIPQFKRILGLRMSALYTALAQLYLIADREPDHSIVNLSLQILTTPSITEEIVRRGNFLTKVMSILYTFLTTRQVGEPYEVNPNATLAFDAGTVTNRRLYHFFLDLRYLLQSEYVQNHVRNEEQYLSQFLDFIKLSQGICPNVRAVGEHVEYETDAWISASILMREINRLCRQFCEAFRKPELDGGMNLFRALQIATVSAIVHSAGLERKRFDQAEIRDYVRFKTLPCFDFEVDQAGQIPRYRVVDFVVEKGYISFHHAVHYTLSWLLECARNMSDTQMREALLLAARAANDNFIHDDSLSPDDLLLAMFDFPLRVCAWLAQMKAGMWVRNGLSLRHQMSQYRGVSSRDFAYYRDIFLLQTALVTCDPSRVLASIADRFGIVDWMTRNYTPRAGFEDAQIIDVAEEFVHLLIVLLTDRNSLTTADDSQTVTRDNIKRDIAHVLCFKALSYSDLSTRLSDKLLDSDMFQDTLDEVAGFRPPEGLNDTGTFELKPEYIDLIDPYSAHYTKNQRDEAENIYREWMAKKTGKKPSDIVFEPKLRPITSGAFSDLSRFTGTLLFAQIVHQCLDFVMTSKDRSPTVPPTRVETFLQVVLHLVLAATLEDNTREDEIHDETKGSFISYALSKARQTQAGNLTIIGLLEKISVMAEFSACGPKIRHILKRLWQRRPQAYASATASLRFPFDRVDTSSPAIDTDNERELKKKQALERQARVMAQFQQQQQNFLNSQGDIDWGEEDFSDLESEPEAAPEARVWKYPSGTCILCQEETNDSRLYGTFALIQDSGILRQTDVQDPDWVREVLRTPSSLDRSAEHIRPFGVAGENRLTVRKLNSAGDEVISEKIGLSKGFDAKNTVRGPVTTGCGHIMHYSCFEVYFTATQRRHTQQIARNHPERLFLKEFVCPLCKALGNAFLPITWKGKEESYPGPLSTNTSFDEFLKTGVETALSRPQNHAALGDTDTLQLQLYNDMFFEYLQKSFVPPLAGKVEQLVSSSPLSTAEHIPVLRMPMPGLFPSQDDAGASSPLQQVSAPVESPMSELLQIYKRLKKTLRVNHIHSTFNHPPETTHNSNDDLVYTDSLFQSFGFSIAAVEIAQRGIESEVGSTLLDKIPQLTLTHLRVLAETALSYAAVGCLYNSTGRHSRAADEFEEMHRQKICQLFAGHPCLEGTALLEGVRDIEPIFAKDTFVFLAECSLSLLPVLKIDIRHLVQLCYVAEIVKVAMAFIMNPSGLKKELAEHGDAHYLLDVELSDERYGYTKHFFNTLVSALRNNVFGQEGGLAFPVESGYVKDGEDSATPGVIIALRRLVSSYALAFLRKTVILLHVQHGVDFPTAGFNDMVAPELDRLTKLLQLPSVDEIFVSLNPAKHVTQLDEVVAGWISHWNSSRSGIRIADHQLWPSLSHPSIFELIGLPKYFDSLIEEANRKRCPNSKKELSDPSICLFCGDIFCSQAVCCMTNNRGGCNQHLQKCGKNVGLFINIRKCMILYLHNQNGSWHFAPYLDRHGEVDPGLRRNRQLILNQKRYDRLLRDVWLHHNIPATISRKLEADINNGGWETI